MKLVYFGVLSAIQPSPALKNMNFDIKQTTKTKHIETKYRNTQKRFQPDDSGTKKLELLTASASVACFCTLYWLSLICLARLAKVDDYLKKYFKSTVVYKCQSFNFFLAQWPSNHVL